MSQSMGGSTAHTTTWAHRARQWAMTNTRPTFIAAAVGFGVGWFLNVWIMAARYDGFRTPIGAPATGAGNLLQGTVFYLVVSALLSAVISFRLIVGPERFAREVKALPQNIKQAVTDDGDQTAIHLLTGFAGSMVIVLVVGPSTAAVLAAGTLLAFTPLLRPVVTTLLMRAYIWVMRHLAPRHAMPPPSVAMLVGILGSTGGFALGWLLPGGVTIRLALGIVAAIAAVVLAQRARSGSSPGGGSTPTMLAILAATSAGVLAAWVGDLSLAFADDGGFRECGNPDLWNWLTSCDGSGTVMGNALIGAAAAGAGAAAGAALGATADGATADGERDGDEGALGPDGSHDGDRGASGAGSSGGTDDEDEGLVPVGPRGPNPFDLDRIRLEDIDWDLMPAEMRQRIRNQLIQSWREQNPNADYIRMQQAGAEIDAMLEGQGRIAQWMERAWDFTKDSAAFTWDDFKSGAALASISGVLEGMVDGMKDGAIGIIDMVRNAPEMVGVAIEFWASQNPVDSVRQIMQEIPEMGREMAEQFVGIMDELHQAALDGDTQRVGQIIGQVAGNVQFEILMGAGSLKAATMGREAMAGTRFGRVVENAEDFIRGPRDRSPDGSGPGAGPRHADIDNPGPTRRPDGETVTVRQLEGDFGYDRFTAEFLDAKAAQHGVLIEMKPANPQSLKLIADGEALAKPELLKPKTTNNLDLEIGAPRGSEGKVTYFEPQRPPNYDSLSPNDPLRQRYDDRMGQWDKYRNTMDELQKPPSQRSPEFQEAMRQQYGQDVPLQIDIRDGVIYDRATGKPFAGDYDVWGFRDARTGEYVSPNRAQQIYDDMGYASNPQHGPGTAHWNPDDPGLQDIKRRLQSDHSASNPNGENLLQFDGSGLPKTGWVD